MDIRALFKPFVLLFYLSGIIALISCKEETTPEDPYSPTYLDVNYVVPYRFPALQIPKDNPLTEEGVTLGRKLYYDPALSKNGNQSCASCHLQEYAFTTPHMPNVLAHINLGWKSNFLWKGEIEGTLEDAMVFEIATFFQSNLSGIQAKPEYRTLFKKAFGSEEITLDAASRALAQYLRTKISESSKFDLVQQKKTIFTPAEKRGHELFFSEKGDCFHCHGWPLFTDHLFHNTGLDSLHEGENRGRYLISGKDYDLGRFVTPTLRNIALTAPYMHDGRFSTLKEVLDFYSAGIKHSSTLDPVMIKTLKPGEERLTEEEKADLIAFLHTLTDREFITSSSFSKP